MGDCYYYGKGVDEDKKEAVIWYELAASQGDAVGQYSLGYCYDNGDGVERDKREAVRWYRLSDNQGNIKAKIPLFTLRSQDQTRFPKIEAVWKDKINEFFATYRETKEILKFTKENLNTIEEKQKLMGTIDLEVKFLSDLLPITVNSLGESVKEKEDQEKTLDDILLNIIYDDNSDNQDRYLKILQDTVQKVYHNNVIKNYPIVTYLAARLEEIEKQFELENTIRDIIKNKDQGIPQEIAEIITEYMAIPKASLQKKLNIKKRKNQDL